MTIVPDDAQPQKSSEPEWVSWSDEQLLDVRLCDLRLRIAGTELSKCVRQLYRELNDLARDADDPDVMCTDDAEECVGLSTGWMVTYCRTPPPPDA